MKRYPAPGRLISVGRHRLHIFSQGSSSGPVAVIEQGVGEPSKFWWPIQEKIAAFARICAYDRAGYLWSEPAGQSRSVGDRAEELHALLINAHISGPYLLVGHSYGGLIIRQFALRYPQETAGLILVDTPDEPALCEPEVQKFYARMRLFTKVIETASRFGLPRLLRHIPILREGLSFVSPREYAAAGDELASLRELDCSASIPGLLDDLPIVVITHGQPFPGPFALLEKVWPASQQRLVMLSSQSTLITAEKSNHMIHLDQPEIVIDVIRETHDRLLSVSR
ncbi:MAG TPA: alpha/beta hydrolase [Silvibacterium sp.]|nr:alpha/beta hydrolase [Silvibacterium sp.]